MPGSLRQEQHRCRIYEQLGLGELADEPIRPGGLELTVRAVALAGWTLGARVLDLGCGTGTALRYLLGQVGFGACGIDPSSVLLAQGRRRDADLPMIRARGEDLPFAVGSLDGVLAECSLSLAADGDRVLRECARVMKDGALASDPRCLCPQPGGNGRSRKSSHKMLPGRSRVQRGMAGEAGSPRF